MQKKVFSISIDGPSGSGKTTIGKVMAEKIGMFFISSGLIYRTVALYLIENNIEPKDIDENLLKEINIEYIDIDHVILNEKNVIKDLFSTEISKSASLSAWNPIVRKHVNKIIKKIASETDVIVEGRDIGTAVLPQSVFKIFISADVRIRAQRRKEQVKTIEEYRKILDDIVERDDRDISRPIDPLTPAIDSFLFLNNDYTIEEATDTLIEEYHKIVKH